MPTKKTWEKDDESFEKVGNKRRMAKRNLSPEGQSKTQTANRFEALSNTMEEGEGSGDKEKPDEQNQHEKKMVGESQK